jgi:pectinesterase
MTYRLLLLLLCPFWVMAQQTSGITGQIDTSFSNYKAWQWALKTNPEAKLAKAAAGLRFKSQRNIVYKKIGQRKLVMDEFAPIHPTGQTILFIHGGGWRSGNRSQHEPLAKTLAARGYHVFLVEYRLSTEALYPAAMLDVKSALSWLISHAKEKQINPHKIAVAGFSAGGQMAALLGTTQDESLFGPKNPTGSIAAVIDIDGILAYIHPESGEGDDRVRTSAATYYFGYSKTENPTLWNQASALNHVSATDPPFLILNSQESRMHAGRDDLVAKMTRLGIQTQVHTFSNAPHTFCMIEEWFEPTVHLMDSFLQTVFKPKTRRWVVGPHEKLTSIQSAIQMAKSYPGQTNQIFIKNGLYKEKIFLDSTCRNMQLIGESRQLVIIQYAEARDSWRCSQPDDYGAGVVNIQGSDISFENLTVINPYGLEATSDKTIPCLTEAGKENVSTVQKYALPREKGEVEGMKIVRKDGHQFAIRSMPGATRLKFIHCTFRSGGGDTVSPWDVATGLYYFKDCEIEGGVDLYCPRGYALAENCTFICHNLSAAVWHDGSQEEQAKTVLSHCTFKGDPGFKLGRYHREAQMFLFDCQFAKEMADAPIYQAGDRKLTWGHRIFYNNCHREAGDFAWFQTNTTKPDKQNLFQWVFENKWK